jgi:Ca-activated chloride channel family protein
MLRAALGMFGPVDDCRRKVIDVSGDGNDNAGTSPEQARREAEARDVMINALAIEGLGRSVTNFYTRSVITQGGFVMTSRGLTGYAETLRAKIFRETARTLF